jgi:protein-S-isoprenylcysteine O-methyltransferase Ste14
MELPALGRRGGGWVVAQSVVLVAIAVLSVVGSRWPSDARAILAVIGAVLVVAGVVLFLAGVRALGPALTPYPSPREDESLRSEGVYGSVRHPIYGGLLLATFGWSLATSPWALGGAVALLILFELKSRHEEALLERRHPGYVEYRERVHHRFIPWIRGSRVVAWLAIVLAVGLTAVSTVALIFVHDQAEHGWADFGHAATVPVIAIVVALALAGAAVWVLARRR